MRGQIQHNKQRLREDEMAFPCVRKAYEIRPPDHVYEIACQGKLLTAACHVALVVSLQVAVVWGSFENHEHHLKYHLWYNYYQLRNTALMRIFAYTVNTTGRVLWRQGVGSNSMQP